MKQTKLAGSDNVYLFCFCIFNGFFFGSFETFSGVFLTLDELSSKVWHSKFLGLKTGPIRHSTCSPVHMSASWSLVHILSAVCGASRLPSLPEVAHEPYLGTLGSKRAPATGLKWLCLSAGTGTWMGAYLLY